MSSLSEKFPDEIWLTIFNNKELEYKHLKKLTRVSKHFRELIKCSVFDKTLFRTPLSKSEELISGSDVKLHRFLYKSRNQCNGYRSAFKPIIDKYNFSTNTRSRSLLLTEREVLKFPSLLDFATSPTTTIIVVHCNDPYTVTNNDGITVKDVIERTIKYWNDDTTFKDDGYESDDSQRDYVQSRFEYSIENDNCLWHKFNRAEIKPFNDKPTIHIITGFFY